VPVPFPFSRDNNESLHRAALSLFLSLALFIAHFRRAARGGNTIALRRRPPSAERKRIENPKYIHILTHTNTHMMGPKKMLLSLYASLLSISPLLPSLPPSTQSYIIPVLVYSENDGWMETHTQSQGERIRKKDGFFSFSLFLLHVLLGLDFFLGDACLLHGKGLGEA